MYCPDIWGVLEFDYLRRASRKLIMVYLLQIERIFSSVVFVPCSLTTTLSDPRNILVFVIL